MHPDTCRNNQSDWAILGGLLPSCICIFPKDIYVNEHKQPWLVFEPIPFYLSEFLKWGLMCFILAVIFGLLSSSLLLLVEAQYFGPCILWPSLDVPCSLGHRNYSTWEIIGFYISNSSHDTSHKTFRYASWVDRHGKQWHHYLNNIFTVLERLLWSTIKILK